MRWPGRRARGRHAAVPAPRSLWAQPAYPVSEAAPVRLGFADGTEVELDAEHPNAVALRTVADLLVQDPRRDADTTEQGTVRSRRNS